jgi:hypothetical protein
MPHVHKQYATKVASVAMVTSGLLLVALTVPRYPPEKNGVYLLV